MLIAYIDESGDTGISSLRSSATFTLGCVLIDADDWNEEFDELIEMRRRLRDRFKIPLRAEIKANYLVRSSGALKGVQLSPGERSLIYRAHLKQLGACGKMQAFGVVVHKSMENSGETVLAAAWKPLLQRLERASFHSDQSPMLIIHDEGVNPTIRKLARQSRRHLLAGSATEAALYQSHSANLSTTLFQRLPMSLISYSLLTLLHTLHFGVFTRHHLR